MELVEEVVPGLGASLNALGRLGSSVRSSGRRGSHKGLSLPPTPREVSLQNLHRGDVSAMDDFFTEYGRYVELNSDDDDKNDPGDDVTNVLLGADEELGVVEEVVSSGVGHTGLWNDPDIVDFMKRGISEIESHGVSVAFFGENVLNYNIGLGVSGIYEMLVFFDNASFPTELTAGVYKSVMIDMIAGFLEGLTKRLNHSDSRWGRRFVLSQPPDSEKEEKFHYFTSSFVFEIRDGDGDGNVVFYCEFGRIQNIDVFKRDFTYPRDGHTGLLEETYPHPHPLLPYYLNDDGFLFTFFLTMKTMKIKRGIAYFEDCITKIKQHRYIRGDKDRKRAFKNKLIELFTVRFSEMFNTSMIMPVELASGKKMYLPLYQIIQTEILQEIFILFDAKVDVGGGSGVGGVGGEVVRLSYRDFAMRLNQRLLKAVGGGGDPFGNTSEGGLMSIYQLLMYYTNALNDVFGSDGCLAQESGGDVSKKYTLDADVDGAPYLSDVDIKFIFPESRVFGVYETPIINSLFYLISFLEKHRYLRYRELIVGTVRFGSHIFDFVIDSESQKRIFGIRYAKDWNGLAGLLSADIKLNIQFRQRGGGDGTVYNGKFVMAFFDVACWRKSRREIAKYQYSTDISQVAGVSNMGGVYVSNMGLTSLMKIPSLGASLKESNELVYDQKEQREKVNKHGKDITRRIEYLKLARMVIQNNRDCLDKNHEGLLTKIVHEIDNVGDKDAAPLSKYDWTKLDCLTNIDALPLKQLQTICEIEQVVYMGVDSRRFESNKMRFIDQIRRSFEISESIDATRVFLESMANNKAKTSYRGNPVLLGVLRGGGGVGGGGGRRRRKCGGVTKNKQNRRISGTRRRR
jgi:hypothetical protein